jgi:hypothetical protein
MKKSEQLELEACQQENDSKAWALHNQAKRESRMETFEETELPKVNESENVTEVVRYPNSFFRITFKDGLIVDYYPKKDRLKVIKPEKWHHNGLSWIKTKL